jgi:tricorn protease
VIEIYPDDPQAEPRRLEGLDLGRAVVLKLSPMADQLALANHRNELLLIDLQSGDLTLVDRSPYRLIAGFDWSPDGRWLAYGYATTSKTTAIRLYRLPEPDAEDQALRQGAVHTITQPILRDLNPAFDPDGKYLYFLSYREFNPVYDNLQFELGFPWGMRPYLVTLQANLPNPFIPLPGFDDDDEEEEAEETDQGEDVDDALDESAGASGDENGDEEEAYDEFEEDDIDEDIDLAVHRMTSVVAGRGDATSTTPQTTPPKANGSKTGPAQTGKEAVGKPPERPRLQIDLEGIAQRILPFPVPDGRYGQIAGIPGKALFTALPVEGALDGQAAWDDEHEDAGTLRCYTFAEYKTESLAENVSWFQLSRDGKRLLYSAHRRLRVLPAGEKPQIESGPSRRTGWIDLYRVKVSVEPQREWEQMFREAWRLQRDHFWTEDMSEVDWLTIYERYFPLIERVSTRSEFSDLMWEMQGELGTSHAYEYGGDYRSHPHYSQGFLGTTFTWDAAAGGYRVGPIIVGDPWDLNSTSPLAAPGIHVEPGDLLLAINGQRLDATTPPAQLLVSQAGQDVLLTFAARPIGHVEENGDRATAAHLADQGATAELNSALNAAETGQKLDNHAAATTEPPARVVSEAPVVEATMAETAPPKEKSFSGLTMMMQPQNGTEAPKNQLRSAIVRTIYGEEKAYYRAWINRNQQRVHEATEGRVGYVHIPDMGANGYAEFHRSYLAEVDREALIVDVRYNGGGHVSQLILEKLARRRLGYDFSRWGGLEPYPADSVAGPIVALTNEHAGSDGDIFCHSFKMMKLGPLIGKRTWGGVVGISPHHTLVDGTVTTQPEFSFWFEDVGWSIENHGAEPDIEVDIRPQDYRSGTDPQLERAIVEVMQHLIRQPIAKPDITTRPSRALPKLPPRLNHSEQ